MLADFILPSHNKMMFLKSGVYRITEIPTMNREIFSKLDKNMLPPDWHTGNNTKWHNSDFIGTIDAQKYNEAAHKELYRGNLYKPDENYSPHITTMGKKYISVSDIMTYMGEENAVYYYVPCRWINDPVSPTFLKEIKAKSDTLQETVHL
jgi:hypothetical protein